MIRHPPDATRTDPPFPATTSFRSDGAREHPGGAARRGRADGPERRSGLRPAGPATGAVRRIAERVRGVAPEDPPADPARLLAAALRLRLKGGRARFEHQLRVREIGRAHV